MLIQNNSLSRIFGSSEVGYTHAFALALLTLSDFRLMFLRSICDIVPPELQAILENNFDIEPLVETEYYLGQYGRIDVQMHFSEKLVIGIENKRTAPLGHEQLHRYANYYEKLFGSNFVLVLLSPSDYVFHSSDFPSHHNVVHLTYAGLADGIKSLISNESETSQLGPLYKRLYDHFSVDRLSASLRATRSNVGVHEKVPRSKPDSWKAAKRNVLGEPFYFNWGLRTTWEEYDAMPQRFGFKTNSTAILDAAALEERTGIPIRSYADYEGARDLDKSKYIVKGKLIKDEYYHPNLCDHVLRRAGSEEFRIKTRNLARYLGGTPLTERIRNEIAAKPANQSRYSAELAAEYDILGFEDVSSGQNNV